MIYCVRRHVDVERDILVLATWIAQDSHQTAFRFPNHLILYEFRGDEVFVLAVVHGARRYFSPVAAACS